MTQMGLISRTATTLVKANPITDSEKAVERAWNDIFHNNNLSVENFNAIITNFQTNSAYVGNTGKQFDPVANVSEFHSSLFYLENNGYMYDIKLFNAMSNDHFTAPKALVGANPDIRNTPKPQWMWSNDDWIIYNAGITPSGVD